MGESVELNRGCEEMGNHGKPQMVYSHSSISL